MAAPLKSVHEETGKAWEIVAQRKHLLESDERVRLLKAGGHSLLAPELDVLGPLVRDANVVHLQCSHGLDALSFLNLGAASVVGIDISASMIEQARATAAAVGLTAMFVRSDVLDVSTDLNGRADIVYTGKGALPWLMDLSAWAAVVARLLRPGGRVFVFEGHPLDWLWERDADTLRLREDVGYFDDEARENPGFPADVVERALGNSRPKMLERQWRPDQVIGALLGAGLRLELFREYSLPFWNQFPSWPKTLLARLPHSYSVVAAAD